MTGFDCVINLGNTWRQVVNSRSDSFVLDVSTPCTHFSVGFVTQS
jgi:hypothetical protein